MLEQETKPPLTSADSSQNLLTSSINVSELVFFMLFDPKETPIHLQVPDFILRDWKRRNMVKKEFLWFGHWRIEVWADAAGPVDQDETEKMLYN